MQVLTKPVLTEKVAQLTEKLNRFVFKVDHRANKIQIKAAVEEMYGVTVTAVNTMKYAGKLKKWKILSGTSTLLTIFLKISYPNINTALTLHDPSDKGCTKMRPLITCGVDFVFNVS